METGEKKKKRKNENENEKKEKVESWFFDSWGAWDG